jgi:2-succinyl-5-enolpyruvyl-6-hydroxy-3-cyclohexene-1-carboxylate synthase
MAVLQPILNLVEICVQHGVDRVVVSPGSRSAALTLAFVRHPSVIATVVTDERSAGYIALGMAQTLGRCVALVCTSGTAATNYASAIAEAYFLEVPLLVLTADRPPEWINQYDGQTIFQQDLYGKHVKKSISLPADYTHSDAQWYVERVVNEAILIAQKAPLGPVHLNVPIREPFYPTKQEAWRYPASAVRLVKQIATATSIDGEAWRDLMDEFERCGRVLIAVGQHKKDTALELILHKLSTEYRIPVLAEIISNLNQQEFILHADNFLGRLEEQQLVKLQPDLLITTGKSFLSKHFKNFIRKFAPQAHWHVQAGDVLRDPFKSLTVQIPTDATYFFERLLEDLDFRSINNMDDSDIDEAYQTAWQQEELKAMQMLTRLDVAFDGFAEICIVKRLLAQLPNHSQLHLANSMSVRYASMAGLFAEQSIEVHANRGTSGIDGCLSTAVGCALSTNQMVYVLIGDLAFFYDRNALWISELPSNLRVILLNNQGGSIFRMIEGPNQLPELERFFETPHGLDAKLTAEEFGLTYLCATNYDELDQAHAFFEPEGGAKLLEIKTNRTTNYEALKLFRSL